MFPVFAAVIIIMIVGFIDDTISLSPKVRFIIEIILILYIMQVSGKQINDFHGLWGLTTIPEYISIPLTIFACVGIINAINLIDGIDGLASSICIVALSVFGVLFANRELWMFSQLAFVCVGILIPFFMYNVFGNIERGHKIFMGDTGSLTLGYVLSFLVIKYCMYTGSQYVYEGNSPLVIAFSILLVPCLDVIRVVIGRVRRGKSPFLPDRTHIHHKFMAMGFTPRKALILIQLISTCFIAGSFWMSHYEVNINIIFLLNIAVWTGLNIWFTKVIDSKNP